eukprot:SAG25_NODE_1323_length_3291_cov_3.272243_3_plen_90_part_00
MLDSPRLARETHFRRDSDTLSASVTDLKFNRAVQGTLEAGATVPMDDITLTSLDGNVASMREVLTTPQCNSLGQGGQDLPVAIIAGSIT